MSELIRKYQPPKLSKKDIDKGVRYLSEVPKQKDSLGNDLEVGDLVIYASGYAGTPMLHVGKIIGTYARIVPQRNYDPRVEVGISLVKKHYGTTLSRVTTTGGRLIKFTEDLCSQEIKDIVVKA